MDGAGDAWSEFAGPWSRYWAAAAEPAQRAIIDAAGVGRGTRVLDVGCGSGEFIALLNSVGARASGCDPAEGMTRIAAALNPGSDIRRATVEALPWPDDAFELVTAINVLGFADSESAALAELRRVGDRIALANWAEDARNDLTAIEMALAGEDYEPSDETREVGYLSRVLEAAGLTVEVEAVAAAPMRLQDDDALVAAFTFGEEAERVAALAPVVLAAAAPFRLAGGGYLLRNEFRYAVARR